MTELLQNDNPMQKLGRWLKECRERAGMSRSTLAFKLGTTYEAIRLYEEGRRTMKTDRFLEILAALNIDIDDFFSQTGR